MPNYSGHEPRFTIVAVERSVQRGIVLIGIDGWAILNPKRIGAGWLPGHLRGVTSALHHRDENLLGLGSATQAGYETSPWAAQRPASRRLPKYLQQSIVRLNRSEPAQNGDDAWARSAQGLEYNAVQAAYGADLLSRSNSISRLDGASK